MQNAREVVMGMALDETARKLALQLSELRGVQELPVLFQRVLFAACASEHYTELLGELVREFTSPGMFVRRLIVIEGIDGADSCACELVRITLTECRFGTVRKGFVYATMTSGCVLFGPDGLGMFAKLYELID